MCHYGTHGCHGPDREHTCRVVEQPTDGELLQDVMRDLATADAMGVSLTIDRDKLRVLCEALRIASVMDGTAILYALENPTFSNPAPRDRVAVIGGRVDVCGRCGLVITPSNPHEDCWPRMAS